MSRTLLSMSSVSAILTVLVSLTASCSPERLRPGPPSISIEVPPGSTIESPDTVLIRVTVTDPNGLSSVEVSFVGVTEQIDVSTAEVEVTGIFAWPIPAGLDPGTVLTIAVRAVDLTGAATVRQATVTVVSPALLQSGDALTGST